MWVEEYGELGEQSGVRPGKPLNLLCSKMDIDLALTRLRPKEYQAVLLCGLLSMSARTAGRLIGVPKSTINRRYLFGLERLVNHLNGSTT